MKIDVVDTNYIFGHKGFNLWKKCLLGYGIFLVLYTTGGSLDFLKSIHGIVPYVSQFFIATSFILVILNSVLFLRIGEVIIDETHLKIRTGEKELRYELATLNWLQLEKGYSECYHIKSEGFEVAVALNDIELKSFKETISALNIELKLVESNIIKALWHQVFKKESTSKEIVYVYVEEDGTVRKISGEEQYYLRKEYDPRDDEQPYIKSRYRSKTLGGNFSGFLLASKLPKGTIINEYQLTREVWRSKWLLLLKDITDLEYLKRIWLPKSNSPYNSYISFRLAYEEGLGLINGIEKQVELGYISQEEYKAIASWHKLFLEYTPPNENVNDLEAILSDKYWLAIIEEGQKTIENLRGHLDRFDRGKLV